MEMNPDRLMEARRRMALAKLNDHDIEALGAEKYVIYEKLQNHNVDDEDDESKYNPDWDVEF